MRKGAILIAIILHLTSICFAQAGKHSVDSLVQVATSNASDSLRIKANGELAVFYIDSSYAISQSYLNEAKRLAKNSATKIYLVNAYHQVGYTLYNKGELELALDNLTAALAIAVDIDDINTEGDLHNDIGLVYKNWGKYDVAIGHFGKAMDCYQKGSNLEGVAMASNNIGQIYYYTSNYPKAIEYFKRYYDVNLSLGNSRAVAGASNNIASAYIELNESDKAMEFYLVALRIYDSLGVKVGVGVIKDNIGTLMQRKGMLSDALSFHLKALEIFKELNSNTRICFTLKNIGHVYHLMGNQKEGANTLEEALALAKRLGIRETEKEIYETLASIYASTNNYPKAYENLSRYVVVKDSLVSEETSLKLREVEAQYQNAQRETEIQNLKKESSKERQRKIIFLSFLVTTLVIISLLLLEIARNKRNFNAIAKQNKGLLSLTRETNNQTEVPSINALYNSAWIISTCPAKPKLIVQTTNQPKIKVLIHISCNNTGNQVSAHLLSNRLNDYLTLDNQQTTSYIATKTAEFIHDILEPLLGTKGSIAYMVHNQTNNELIVNECISGFHFKKGNEPILVKETGSTIDLSNSNYLLLFLNQGKQKDESLSYVRNTLSKITHFSNNDIKETMQSNLLFWKDGLKQQQQLNLIGIPLD